ncbi:hypothetical protein [Brevundimonas sp. SL161]|uniref:hypothetical protein n=1 Tax=Brevundimonas sp. SL161 TaxID=2804613 RepID=UPI003CF88D9D
MIKRCGAGLAGALFALTPSVSICQVPEPEASLVAKAQQITDRSTELARIWPGYWPEGQAFVLYEPANGAVIVGTDGSSNSVRYQAGELPGADTTFVFDYPGGSPNMMLMTLGSDWSASAQTLFHEQFHDFQSDTFDKSDMRFGGEYVDLSSITDRIRFTAAAEMERRILADALSAQTDTQRDDLVRRYFVLRREREATASLVIASVERNKERYEGTAVFVAETARALVARNGGVSLTDGLVKSLRDDLHGDADRPYATSWFRWRAYGVGAALCWLLEKRGTDWRARVERGEALDLILEEIINPIDPDDIASISADTRRLYDEPKLIDEIQSTLAALPESVETVADFNAQSGLRLVLNIDIPMDRLLEGRTFFQSQGMIALSPTAMALPDVTNFHMERPGILLRVAGFTMMTDSDSIMRAGVPVRRSYTILLKDSEILTDIIALGSGEHTQDSISIDFSGLKLKIEQPVTVSADGDQISINAVIDQ